MPSQQAFMIFAINKIDKENADANKIKEKLSGMNILWKNGAESPTQDHQQ